MKSSIPPTSVSLVGVGTTQQLKLSTLSTKTDFGSSSSTDLRNKLLTTTSSSLLGAGAPRSQLSSSTLSNTQLLKPSLLTTLPIKPVDVGGKAALNNDSTGLLGKRKLAELSEKSAMRQKLDLASTTTIAKPVEVSNKMPKRQLSAESQESAKQSKVDIEANKQPKVLPTVAKQSAAARPTPMEIDDFEIPAYRLPTLDNSSSVLLTAPSFTSAADDLRLSAERPLYDMISLKVCNFDPDPCDLLTIPLFSNHHLTLPCTYTLLTIFKKFNVSSKYK